MFLFDHFDFWNAPIQFILTITFTILAVAFYTVMILSVLFLLLSHTIDAITNLRRNHDRA